MPENAEIFIMLCVPVMAAVAAIAVWRYRAVCLECSRLRDRISEAENELAAARKSGEMKTRYMANLAHEVRSPLNALVGMASLLDAMNPTDEQRQCIDTMNICGERLNRMFGDMLDFGSMELGKLALYPAACDLDRVIRGSLDAVRIRWQPKNVRMEYEKGDSLPETVTADEARLGQVLVNLLDNAVKHTDEGHVVVRAAMELLDGGGKGLCIEVEDTGSGIPADLMDKVFEPFTQGPNAREGFFGGVGLGLTIARQLIERMGGSLTVTSTPGKGTTATIRLPA